MKGGEGGGLPPVQRCCSAVGEGERDGNTCTVLSEEKGEGKKGERTKDQ